MTKPKLTIIEGGLSSPKESEEKYFVSAYVTDTRLMGVVGLYIHWKLPSKYATSDFHQFFYFDAEEYGLETYRSLLGNNVEEIALIEQALIGGLGGKKVEVTEQEARYLVCQYAGFNKRKGISLPGARNEYKFLLEPATFLNSNEQNQLMTKQCGKMTGDYQVINYFLMRCFAHDYEGAAFLAASQVDLQLYKEHNPATLCKNTIDTSEDGDGIFMCESLIEYDDKYVSVISKISISGLKIMEFSNHSWFVVSAPEAAMMLSRPEFITVYEVLLSAEDLARSMEELSFSAMMTSQENGHLYLSFNKNNDHVSKRIFRLSEDVFGLYYITDYGQLLVSAYSISNIHSLERDLRKSTLSPFLMVTAKYEFKEPVLYEFMQSDFEDFSEFLDFIRNEE